MFDSARLVLGPLLRHAAGGSATVWVEVDAPCRVAVVTPAGRAETSTFHVGGQFFALVLVEGVVPGRPTPYEVHLDDRRVWPLAGAPPSLIRTPAAGEEVRMAFGSCRVSLPHHPPYTLSPDEDPKGREHDALHAMSLRMQRSDPATWPHALLMMGDQIYVDEGALQTRARIRARRDTTAPPGDGPVDFCEYAWLYHEAWGDPSVRWLLSTVSTGMIWDDHDMHDDWNISASWVAEMRRHDWWHRRVLGAVASYWVYQHLGNLSPEELGRDELWAAVQTADDALPLLHEHARGADQGDHATRWSWSRDTDGVRVVCMDSRAGRVLDDTGDGGGHDHGRAMVDDAEWRWIEERATGGVEHLVLATSLPVFLLPGIHWLEAWNEAVADGAWGGPPARAAEKLRRSMDLEHWPAFQDTFGRLVELVRAVSEGERGDPPATITIISGDVHHAYLARVEAGGSSRVSQAVCSPFRNSLNRRERAVLRFGGSRAAQVVWRALAGAAGVKPTLRVRWRVESGPFFENQVATLAFRGPDGSLRIEKTVPGDARPELETCCERPL